MSDETPFEPTLASPAARQPLPHVTPLIGRYRVLRELGRGAMGVVLLAEDTLLGRQVALKSVGAAPGGQLSLHMTSEARAIARLQHPNVVGLYDVLQQDGQAYLAMEYVEGGDLQRWMSGSWTTEQRVALFVQIALGLEAAHGAGIVHRDFKPANVLVGADGRPRVSDFGLAAMQGEQDAVARGDVVGTPAYMAPEQWEGKRAGPAADQFAFCAALFEALTGQRPFQGTDYAALEAEVKKGPPAMPPSLPPAVAEVVRRGLSVDPHARFGTMRELRVALEAAGSRRVDRRLLGVAATLTAVVLCGGAFAAYRSSNPCRLDGTHLESVRARVGGGLPATMADSLQATLAGWEETFTAECAAHGSEPSWTRTRGCLEAVLDDVESVSAAAALAGENKPVTSLLQYVRVPHACRNPNNPPRPALPSEAGARKKVFEALAALVDVVALDSGQTRTEQKQRVEEAVELALASGHTQTHARALASRARIEFNLGLDDDFQRTVDRGRTEAASVGALHEVVRLGIIQAFPVCGTMQAEPCRRALDQLQPLVDALEHPWLRGWMLEFRVNANPDRLPTPEDLTAAVAAWKALPGAELELGRAQRGLAIALKDARRWQEALDLVDSIIRPDAPLLGLKEIELALVRARVKSELKRPEEAIRELHAIREAAVRLNLEYARQNTLESEAWLLVELGRAAEALALIDKDRNLVFLEMVRLEALAQLGRTDELLELISHLEYPLSGATREPEYATMIKRYRLLIALERNETAVLEHANEWLREGTQSRLLASCLERRGLHPQAMDTLRAAAETLWQAKVMLAMREGRWADATQVLDESEKDLRPLEQSVFQFLRTLAQVMTAGDARGCKRAQEQLGALAAREHFALYPPEVEWVKGQLKTRCR